MASLGRPCVCIFRRGVLRLIPEFWQPVLIASVRRKIWHRRGVLTQRSTRSCQDNAPDLVKEMSDLNSTRTSVSMYRGSHPATAEASQALEWQFRVSACLHSFVRHAVPGHLADFVSADRSWPIKMEITWKAKTHLESVRKFHTTHRQRRSKSLRLSCIDSRSKDYQDRYLRTVADAENTRKRIERDVSSRQVWQRARIPRTARRPRQFEKDWQSMAAA